ncbi:UDP-Glycosyltransferase/glycogen phosphorylase [Rickenella mellea]|uniref:sterol 3beta-glucosyltransferase n=1 Tax=Rickenella mellea TaxID=50990 RepID=A0A4Y7Q8J7_9AGAM|nr:UDP-Glycosyltransferase/glycogen phosphorylase [Rickenella mellea]
MVHLTTHRIAFHASLLSTRPDLLPEQQIIKKGPITLHRSGLHRKRKLWMELSHDMICSFASSKEEDRIKPLRSILLSSLAGVEPEDPQNPRIVRLKFKTSVGHKNMYATVDNEEAARDWRREIQGALFLYRHRRAAILSNKVDNELNGVRMSIPLSRIENIAGRCFMNISGIFAIQLSDLDNDDTSSSDSTDPASPESRDARTIELAIVQPDALWRNVQSLVDEAKANLERYPDKLVPRAIIDFGGLCFLEAERILSMSSGGEQDHSIKTKLGLGDEGEIWRMKARIVKCVCSSGWLVVSPRFVGFWSKSLTASDIVYRLPTSMVVSATPVQRKYSTSFGMKLVLEGRSDLLFTFPKAEERDEAVKRITAVVAVEHDRISGNSSLSSKIKDDSPDSSRPETPRSTSDVSSFQSSGLPSPTQILSSIEHTVDRARLRNFPQKVGIEMQSRLPKVVNLPQNSIPLLTPKHFVCLTIGSRGDVQPYIALGLGLMKDGHTVTIVTHEEYKEWVEGWGIRHRTAGGDPGALMKLSVEHKMFSPQFFKESLGNFRKWLDELLVDAWEQCKDADVLLESPSAMAGVHIAEALHIPYFRTFTMPWTKTTAFPHSFLSPPVESASFNVSSYILFDNVFWAATSGQVNRWRRHTLKLGNTDMGHLAQSKIPFIYNFSTAVVPKPMDWGDSIVISGYWFLDNPELKWTPPTTLLDWIAKARADGKAIVYIGFGSITVPDPAAMTRSIIKAVLKSDVRAIISKGWSARMAKSDEPEIELPPECYTLDKVPHDWLFPQIDAALHHGGAGTTGASLRAGIPTLIKPWFGDQFFWASRVQKLGAGLKVSSLRSSDLSHALTKATTNRIMKERAATVGQRIRMEDGVRVAIDAIYTYLPRAGRERTGKEKH